MPRSRLRFAKSLGGDRSRSVSNRPSLCENVREPKMRRMVFLYCLLPIAPSALLVFRVTKSRKTFYAHNERLADRVETLLPTALAIAIGNELMSEVEASIRFVKTCSMRWCWTGRVEARRRRLFRP
jgi:hypothetical protein